MTGTTEPDRRWRLHVLVAIAGVLTCYPAIYVIFSTRELRTGMLHVHLPVGWRPDFWIPMARVEARFRDQTIALFVDGTQGARMVYARSYPGE